MDWEDLLGVPWERNGRTMRGLDCAGVAEEVNARLGNVERGELAFPFLTPQDRGRMQFDEFMESTASRFELLGGNVQDARRLGDFVVTDPKGKGYGAHIYVLVATRPRTFLSAILRKQVCSVLEHQISGVVSVHRVRAAR